MKQTKDNKFQILSGRQQILTRPQMWIGSMDARTQSMFVVADDKIKYKEATFIPAFRKIIDEITDNSIDAIISSKQTDGHIKVNMTKDTITINDNGPGIPVIKKDISQIVDTSISAEEKAKLADTYLPEIAWTRLFSGTNFNDDVDKITVGAHGIGSKATAIFSTKFTGRTDDGKKVCTVTAKDNLETSSCKITKSSGRTGTTVTFMPDLQRFKLTEIEQIYSDLVYQRLLCLAITFPDVKFSFNGKRINITARKFASMFAEDVIFQSFDKGFVAIYHNELDEFNFCTYVNGLSLLRGGSHVDYIINQTVAPVRDKLVRRYKTIKPADIRNKLSLVVFMRDFPNSKYDSQTKETLTNAPSEVVTYLDKAIDFSKLALQIQRTPSIIDPIVETFKLKEEVKNRVALKQIGRTRPKIDADKFISATGPDQQYMFICEGHSACSGISQALGRKGISYFASRGVPLNVRDCKTAQIIKNKEFSDIVSILGIDPASHDNKSITYDTIVHANDSDNDGTHILGIYLGWWMKFGPELFNQKQIARLMTPYVILWQDNKMTKIHKAFYNMHSFKAYSAEHDISKYKVNLFKGLGSWSKDQFKRLFDTSPNGIKDFLQYITLDEHGKLHIDNWLKGNAADERKAYLRQYTLDVDQI